MRKLILPINNTRLTASWKTQAYKSRFGFAHYGVDMVSSVGSSFLYACGNGVVLFTGNDKIMGNFLAIKYIDAYNRESKLSSDVVCRMWHMASISVKKGDTVTSDTQVGKYGNTGQFTIGAHLHMDMDTDVNHPMWTPTISGKTNNFIGSKHGANDKSMSNPIAWVHCKSTKPDYQTYTTSNNIYIRTEDKIIENF